MRILNWNTQGDKVQPGTTKFAMARELIVSHDADVICLTEAFPESMPDVGHTIMSELSGAGTKENRGARKVVLWSRFGWKNIDTIGTDKLPEGRFVCATTECDGSLINFIGMCIPYRGYRKRNWQGACEYMDALRDQFFRSQPINHERYWLAITIFGYHLERSPHRLELSTKSGTRPFTAGRFPPQANGTIRRSINHSSTTSRLLLISG